MMLSKIKLKEMYIGNELSGNKLTFTSPENSKEIKINNHSFIFGKLSIRNSSFNKEINFIYQLIRSWHNIASIKNKPIIVLAEYKNIHSFIKEKEELGLKINKFCNKDYFEDYFITGKTFGVNKIFFKEESIIEFISLKNLILPKDNENYNKLICSETLFKHLFKEIEI